MSNCNRTNVLFQAYPIGAIVTTGVDVLSATKGSRGVVYEHYTIGRTHGGCSIIFEGGSYDGFSEQCMEVFEINVIGIAGDLRGYSFSHVGELMADFNRGLFNKALNLKG